MQTHYLAHGEMAGQGLATADKSGSTLVLKQSISVACVNCAQNKTRCDRVYPCGRCSSKGIACVPRAPRRSAAAITTALVAPPVSSPKASVSADTDAWMSDFDANLSGEAENPSDLRSQDPSSQDQEVSMLPRIEHHNDSVSKEENERQAEQIAQRGPGDQSASDQMDRHVTPSTDGNTNALDGFDLGLFLTSGDTGFAENLGWARFLEPPWPPGSREAQPTNTSSSIDSLSIPLDTPNVSDAAPDTPSHGILQQPGKDPSALSFDASGANLFAFDRTMEDSIPLHSNTSVDPSNNFGGGLDTDYSFPENTFCSPSFFNLEAVMQGTPKFRSPLLKNLEHWNICQCTPTPSGAAPIRSGEIVARLGENFGDSAPWSSLDHRWRDQHFQVEERFNKVPLSETTRERMLVIIQAFFRLASDLYDLGSNPPSDAQLSSGEPEKWNTMHFLLLPPTQVLHEYLETFLINFEPFYSLIPERTLDSNKIVNDSKEEIAALLLVLMIAYGAMRDPAIKARRLSTGLVEICRLSLINLLEKDPEAPRTTIAAHCALLCTFQEAFSGEKWLMDSSVGQRHMYLGVSAHLAGTKFHDHLPQPIH
jgi:hypothetical protein